MQAVARSAAAWPDACTIGAATGSATKSGGPIVFSNSDDPFNTRTRLVVEQPTEGQRFIATQIISPPPPVSFNLMHTRGLNEAGFAYTWAYVTPKSEPNDREAIGIPLYQFGKLVLSEARTVADAIAILERYPRAYHGNYLFADASGEIALVEISTRSYHVETRISDGVIARSNHWISSAMTPLGQDTAGDSSLHRYQRASELVDARRGHIDVAAFAEITADHAGRDTVGFSICAHGSSPRWGGSVSSEIIEPRLGRFWYCYGWPCGGAADDPEQQVYQDRSWGTYLPFDLAQLEPGEYVTTGGRLTALGIRNLTRDATRAPAAAD